MCEKHIGTQWWEEEEINNILLKSCMMPEYLLYTNIENRVEVRVNVVLLNNTKTRY